MADFPFDVVGFDLDGTLLDTSGDLAAAVNHVLESASCPPLTVEQVKANVGGGAKRMLARSLADAGCDEANFSRRYEQMLGFYAEHMAIETKPYAGVTIALDALAARGVRLAIVTNKVENLALKLLDAFDLIDRFATVIGGDTLAESKPSPVPIREMIARCGGGRAVFVGDSIYDIDAGRAACVPTIAVSFGFLLQPVETLNADAVIDSYADLIPTLEQIG